MVPHWASRLIRKWFGREKALHQCVHCMFVWVKKAPLTQLCNLQYRDNLLLYCCVTLGRMHTNTFSHVHSNTKGVEDNDTFTHNGWNTLKNTYAVTVCKHVHTYECTHPHIQYSQLCQSPVRENIGRKATTLICFIMKSRQRGWRGTDAQGEEKNSYLGPMTTPISKDRERQRE